MPMIYRRFTEKAADEWRQIYKALQLLEYLIKHGSERVIDDARSHLTLLKMLRQFHFIDQNGKDQGVNVRNRAKELTELLSDVDRIRQERKKARVNKQKYTGVEGGASRMGGFSGSSGGASRYGGFGSETGGSTNYGGFSGGVYGDGGGFGGATSEYGDSSSSRRPDQFEEYDEFDEGDKPAPTRPPKKSTERAGTKKTTPTITGPPKKKEKEPEVDLFSFDDAVPSSSAAPIAPSNGSGLAALSAPAPAANDDDEFDDFQSATPGQPAAASAAFSNPLMTSNASGAAFAAPAPVSAPQQTNLNNMVGLSSISPPPANNTPGGNYSAFSTPLASTTMSPGATPAANKPMGSGYQPSGPNYFTSVQAPQSQSQTPSFTQSQSAVSTPASMGGMGALKPVTTGSSAAAKKPAAGGDAFGALWATASGTGAKKTNTTAGPALGQLAKEKSAAGIWGAPAPAPGKPAGGSQPAAGGSSGLDDLLG